MNDAERSTLLWTQEVLATLIKRMAAENILSEHGATALADEVRAYASGKHPDLAEFFEAHAEGLQQGIAQECEARQPKQ